MLEQLRNWLNGDRDFFIGVALYEMHGDNHSLLELLKKGKTDFVYKKLQDALLKICIELKSKRSTGSEKIIEKKEHAPENKTLHDAALKEAFLLYKEAMNDRAILFASVDNLDFEDPNRADLIAQRSKPAIDLVIKFNRVSELYDRADYVRENGRLPDHEESSNEFEALPDQFVKAALDNARKARNKLKVKEPNAKRVALLQKHELIIEKLEKQWLLLKRAAGQVQ